ncbi:MAG TPA: hypothetical protein ENH87_14925 [Pricia antarctica]|uniref:Lipoprotein n=1 Tax=Pricia antarctica TaxID=641691 RepID=A0A831QRZ4_9FLAO|nr:hypothetical protein [Pricia antarctica]
MKKVWYTFIFVLTFTFFGCEKEEATTLEAKPDKIEDVKNAEEQSEEPEEDTSDESTETDGNEAPGEVEEPLEAQFGLVSYLGRIPSDTSKVPSCKSGVPDAVIFIITDATGITHTESVPASETNGLVSTTVSAPIPLGQNTVNEILLMRGNDTLYAIPNINDFDLARFTDVTVPFDVEVTENTELGGDAFCYSKKEIDVPNDALVDGGFGTQRLQTLWIDVKGECIDIITVTIDNNRVLEIFPFGNGLYDIPIPEDYNRMDIRAYTPEFQSGINDFEVFTFTTQDPYNEDGILDVNDLVQFTYECPLEEFPDDEEDF